MHPYDTIPFVFWSFGHYGMNIIPYHLFDVVETLESPHLTLKKLIEFFKNIGHFHTFEKKIDYNFLTHFFAWFIYT